MGSHETGGWISLKASVYEGVECLSMYDVEGLPLACLLNLILVYNIINWEIKWDKTHRPYKGVSVSSKRIITFSDIHFDLAVALHVGQKPNFL